MSDLGRAPAPVALVDDSVHSARLFLRTLSARGCRARWLGNAEHGGRTLEAVFGGRETAPRLLVVDLKSRSTASAEFIARFAGRARQTGTIVVAMAPSLEAGERQRALDAGADAVFQRHADRVEYHREIGCMIDFWGRNQRLQKVGS